MELRALPQPRAVDGYDLCHVDVGLPVIDEQHQRLLGHINDLSAAVEAGSVADIARVALALIDYSRVHFTYEDEYLQRLEAPGRARRAARALGGDVRPRGCPSPCGE